MPNINLAVQWAINTANDNTHGYSQQNRLGPDYDCSSFVAAALIAGGFNVPAYMYTSIEYNCLIAAGFTTIPVNDPRKKGDIFMWDGSGNAGHTCICIDENYVAEAYGDSPPYVTGDTSGDEIRISPFDDSTGWQYHFRYPGADGRNTAIWHTKNYGAWAKESYEAKDNAVMTYNALSPYGWTINAVAGLLGNIGWESGYNPWMWEGGLTQDTRINSTDTAALLDSSHGYGLVQFTPSGNYCLSPLAQTYPDFGPNYLDIAGNQNDGTAQLRFVHESASAGYHETTDYPETYAEYISSTADADYLARAWFYNYERGTGSTTQREADALYWQSILPGLIESPVKRMKIIFYLNRRRGRRI